MTRTVSQIALVAVGSALGGVARWGVSVWFARRCGVAFPWGTLFINLSGSLFLGWFVTFLDHQFVMPEWWRVARDELRLLVGVGFTGAYTTFSTFEVETYTLLRDDHWLAAASYVAGSVFLGLLAVRLGVWLGSPR